MFLASPCLVLAILSLVGWGGAVPRQGQEAVETRSSYVEMRDGTKLAVDVHLASSRDPESQVPALLVLTRYWRASEDPNTGKPRPAVDPLERAFLAEGYAIVKVDVRGSGASFGTRPVEYGPEEVEDGYDIVQWVVDQEWCSGNVGAFGTSYTGTTAELLAASGHPAVKAVIPGWSDFDVYVSPIRPYGLVASAFLREWSRLVGWMDENATGPMRGSVRRADEDEDGSLLRAAMQEHEENPDVFETVARAEFRDDKMEGGWTYSDMGPLAWKDEIEESKVPMLVLVSWLDAGTIEGALQRFQYFSNPQKVIVLASNHGGQSHASPFAVGDQPVAPQPSGREQFQWRLSFFDHHLKGIENEVPKWPAMRYFNLGEEAYRETDVWPPKGATRMSYFLRAQGSLSPEPSSDEEGIDLYRVDPDVTTGRNNRWMTQMGGPVLSLDDRGAMDERMLTYTTSPFEDDVQVTGTPVVTLHLASDHEDGTLLVYLEDVDPDGRSRYITEGGIRLRHRKATRHPQFDSDLPYQSFTRDDATDLEPGTYVKLEFPLWATSVQLKKGHRLRIAIAGADADTFDRFPPDSTPTFRVRRDKTRPSSISLPVIQ